MYVINQRLGIMRDAIKSNHAKSKNSEAVSLLFLLFLICVGLIVIKP